MKKFEGSSVQANAMTRFGKVLLLTLWVARAALAQDASDFGPPPMVTVEESALPATQQPTTQQPATQQPATQQPTTQQPATQQPAWPQDPAAQPAYPPQGPADAQGVIQPPAVANLPYDQVAAAEAKAKTEEPPGRPLRIITGLLFGAGVGALGGLAGGFAGAATLPDQALQPIGATWTGAAIGFGIAAPLGVLLSGWLFDGDGSGLATFVGDLLGAGIGAAAVLFGGQDGTPLLFALPLVGSVVGYEVTSPSSRSAVQVSATFSPTRDGGGVVGLAGRF